LLSINKKIEKPAQQTIGNVHEIGSSGNHGMSETTGAEKRKTYQKAELEASHPGQQDVAVYEVEGDGPRE
jgi:hypothetical protein